MRILMVGNDPHDIGGVVNYTRPLALKFVEMGHKVFYFYSGAWNRRYNYLFRPYLRIHRRDFSFECAELMNSPNWTYNYGNPLLDIHAHQTEKLFVKYMEKIKPDVVHVHSRCGLPASLIEIASNHGTRVFNTIHVYGFLCQKRVMIDHYRMPCKGPSDVDKCAQCTGYVDIKRLKHTLRIENTSKQLFTLTKLLLVIIRKCSRSKKSDQRNSNDPAPCKDIAHYEKIKANLQERLDYMIHAMNTYTVTNLCVSTDVKKTLMRYGVHEDKLFVQHIGSSIAESQKLNRRTLHTPIVIGNIGGVHHYKGTHVLVEAVKNIKNKNFIVKIFGKYDQAYIESVMQEKEDLPIEFLGKYQSTDLFEILKQIDIMVLPSICNDTAPQTIFESYSAGIPIIASDIGGFPDFIKDGVSGCLFKPGDSQDLADKLDKVLTDHQKIESFSWKIPKLKTITDNALELVALYKKCIEDNLITA